MKYEPSTIRLNPQFQVSNEARMFAYAWYRTFDVDETGNVNSTKFGEHFVKAGEDPVTSIYDYIRDKCFGRTGKKDFIDGYSEGSIRIHSMWDVTEVAKKFTNRKTSAGYSKIYPHQKVDAIISKNANLDFKREATRAEFFSFHPDVLASIVDKYLTKCGQPKPLVTLAPWQKYVGGESIEKFTSKLPTVIVWDMAPRAGKNIAAIVAFAISDHKVMVLGSYLGTSFASFESDATQFEQFKDFVIINSKDEDYRTQINEALADGKKVIVFLSLCKGSLSKGNRDARVRHLMKLDTKVMFVVDEADFGAWCSGQCKIMVDTFKNEYKHVNVILMTGTNTDRAVSEWGQFKPSILSVTYPEMLWHKKKVQEEMVKTEIAA